MAGFNMTIEHPTRLFIGETLKSLPAEFADAEIKETRWFFNTFVIELRGWSD